MPLSDKHHRLPAATLIDQARDARARTIALLDDLDDEQLEVPQLSNVNPPRWELGHIAFFFEVFFLRELGCDPQLLRGADELFDSFHVAHDTRWSLPLPSRDETITYMNDVFESFAERLGSGEANPRETYLALLCTLHEDMHGEALTHTRQTLEYPAPRLGASPAAAGEGDLPATSRFPAGAFSSALPKTHRFSSTTRSGAILSKFRTFASRARRSRTQRLLPSSTMVAIGSVSFGAPRVGSSARARVRSTPLTGCVTRRVG